MTPDDIRRAVAEFRPVPIDDTHRSASSVFHGRLGEVVALAPAPDYSAFGGLVSVPRWFDELFKGVTLPLSANWDRATKRLKSVALQHNNVITDAQLQAAFARAHPEETAVTTATAPAPAPAADDLRAQLDELRKANAELSEIAKNAAAREHAERERRELAEAAAFAKAQTPAGPDDGLGALLAEAHFALSADDRDHGEARFAREGEAERTGARLDLFRKVVAKYGERVKALESRPDVLKKEQIPAGSKAEVARDGTDMAAYYAKVREQAEKDRAKRGVAPAPAAGHRAN